MERIDGLGFKKYGKIHLNKDRTLLDLNKIPDIPYNLIDIERYIQKNEYGAKRVFEVCTSRGCPHRCTFCYNLNVIKCSWRTLDIDKIFENLHYIINKYKIDGINWREDNFFVNKKRGEEIANRIIKEKINIKWHAECRIDYFYNYDQKFIKLLKKSGCHTLTFGVESGSNKVLKSINKDITREQVLIVRDKLIKNRIYQNYHFMIGFPDETREDINQTIDLIYKLVKNNNYLSNVYGPSLYTPYPGTNLYKGCLEKRFYPPNTLNGWIKMDWDQLNVPWITNKEKRSIKNISLNVRGLNKRLFRFYFMFKLYLLVTYSINIPNFEKYLYDLYRKIKGKLLILRLKN